MKTMNMLLPRKVLDDLEDAVLITDTAGVILYINRAAEQLLYIAPLVAGVPLIHEILMLHDAATDQPIGAPLTYLLKLSDARSNGSYTQLVRGDGEKIPIDCSICTIDENRNRPSRIVVTLRPVGHADARTEQSSLSWPDAAAGARNYCAALIGSIA